MPGRIKVNEDQAGSILGRKRAAAERPRTPAPPLPTHEPGSMDEVAEPYRETYDSRDEEEYASHLDQQKLGGHVKEWAYKPVRLRIGDGIYYTPDFRVIWSDGTVAFFEVKGFLREAARVRIHAAAERHPNRFVMVRRRPKKEGGGWSVLYDSHQKWGK